MTSRNPLDFLAFGRPSFADDEIEAALRVMRTDPAGAGAETNAFEGDLAACVGAAHVVIAESPTSALSLSLSALNLRPGDEVICPSLAPCGIASAALHVSAQAVFCDVDPSTLCVTPETVVRHVTARTKAVIVAHPGGLAGDVAALRSALPAHIAIVEDATHAMTARYADGDLVGSSGNLTVFSIPATAGDSAEVGAVAAFDADMARRLRTLRHRMNCTGLQASIGRVQLRRLPELAYHRQTLARHYVDALNALEPSLEFQRHINQPGHARQLLLIKLPTRTLSMSLNDVLAALHRRHVSATVPYQALHRMAAYRSMRQVPLPQAEALADQLLALPINGTMTPGDVDYVVAQLLEVLSDARLGAVAS